MTTEKASSERAALLGGAWFPPRGPYKSDPDRSEAWFWVGLPAVLFVVLMAIGMMFQRWYLRWIEPEGYGILELSHFFVPAGAAVLAIMTLRRPWVRGQPLVLAWLVMLALGCIYIAGEEHSWGQHAFYWETPEYWSTLNRQQETNLHNVSAAFGNLPRTVLFTFIVVAGLFYPLAALLWPRLHQQNPLAFFMPPLALWPTALFLVIVKLMNVAKGADIEVPLKIRLSEVGEIYIYMFLLFGVIILRRRIMELEDAKSSGIPHNA